VASTRLSVCELEESLGVKLFERHEDVLELG